MTFNPLDAIGKLGEAITWYKLFSLATGEGFYAAFALGAVAAVIILAWKSPKLPWFTGRLALVCILVLLIGGGAGFLAVVYNREIEPRIDHARPAAKPKVQPRPDLPGARRPAPPAESPIGG